MKYTGTNEIVRNGPRYLYHIPEADALGLENRAEATRVQYEQDCKRMNRSLNRFRRIANNRTPKKLRTAETEYG